MPDIKAFGCCLEVFYSQHALARWAAQRFGVPSPPRQEIEIDLIGLNHFTWATSATWAGHDLLERLRKEIARPNFFRSRAAG